MAKWLDTTPLCYRVINLDAYRLRSVDTYHQEDVSI